VGIFGFFNRLSLSRDMGIDLGTANTLIYVSGKGIVLQEPSAIAIDLSDKSPIAVGEEARKMLGRTPTKPVNVSVIRPLRDGVIADFDAAEMMLKHFMQKAHEGRVVSPRVVIGIPSGVTGVERRALMDAASQAGAREVYLIDEPLAAAIGAGLPIAEPIGSMIVDIGGGTTEIAVLSLYGTVLSESVRIAGDELNEAIMQYIRKIYNLVIGERTAEEIKLRIGSAYPSHDDEDNMMEVRGLHLLSGLPRTVTIKEPEIRESMSEPLSVIVEAVKRTLERTPPELAADIVDRGIMLAGGGAKLKGLDTLIGHETGIVTHIATEPMHCVVLGAGLALEKFKQMERVFSDRSRRG
jgi:rod shape-determining protein MreB